MRIIRESRLRKMLKEAYEKGFYIGYDIGYHIKKKEGTILSGYDLDKDLEEILKRSVNDGS